MYHDFSSEVFHFRVLFLFALLLYIILCIKKRKKENQKLTCFLFHSLLMGEKRLGGVNDLEVKITSCLYRVTLSCAKVERQVAFSAMLESDSRISNSSLRLFFPFFPTVLWACKSVCA